MPYYDEFIERRDGYSGGYPTLKRMNISVRIIVEKYRRCGSLEELCNDLPQCTREELQAALDYYKENPAIVDEDIERNRRAWEEVVKTYAGPRDSGLSG